MGGLDLATARRLADDVLAEGRHRALPPLAVAVLDERGVLRVLVAEDAVGLLRPDIAVAKAWGVLGMGRSSRAMGARAAEAPAFFGALSELSGGGSCRCPGACRWWEPTDCSTPWAQRRQFGRRRVRPGPRRHRWAAERGLRPAAGAERAVARVTGQSGAPGGADVLVLPDLGAGNIADRLVHHRAGTSAVGPSLQAWPAGSNWPHPEQCPTSGKESP
ncbi:MAG: phosphate acyltransferase [Actinomycetota bacterium]|nr:phosphate acyltransferase [Actinomycetota bacterium]